MRQPAAAIHARFLIPAVAAAVVALACQAGVAGAATFNATDTTSLTAAVKSANSAAGANTIVLAGGTYAPKSLIELTNTTGPITIEGPTPIADEVGVGADIGGAAINPPFGSIMKIDPKVTVNLDNLDISGGGGSTTPTVDDFGSVATEGLTTQGNNGAFTIEPGATANLVNSTFIGNNTVGIQDEGAATLINDTVTQNGEGGIDDSSDTSLSLVNTVVAENNAADGDCFATATSSVNSLDSDGTCGVSLSGKNPHLQLNPSLNNGGSTPTDVPQTGSPLIGAAKASDCPPTDQRGFLRPASCDIGAVQTAKVTPVFNTAAVHAQTPDPSGTTVTYTPSWADTSSPVQSTCTPSDSNPGYGSQQAMFTVGTTSVSCSGVDAFGGKGSGKFNVVVTLGSTTTTTTTSSSTTHTTTTSTSTSHTTTSTPTTSTSTHTSTSTTPSTTTTPSSTTTSSSSSSSVGPAQSTTTTSAAVASTAASTTSQAVVTSASSTNTTQTSSSKPFVGPVAITARQLIGSLVPGLVPGGKNSTISSLLEHGGISVTLHVLEGGVVKLDWYSGGAGAIVAKAKKPKVKAVLVAAGSATAGGAGSVTVKITLTSAGRKLLKHASTIKLIGEGGFKPSSGAQVSTSKQFELHSARTASASAASALGSWTQAVGGLLTG